jgi:phosphohistidine swiveling domain-containing protein
MGAAHEVPLVLALDDPRATLGTVGGKAESLGRLARAGFPVPSGFCLTTAAYQLFTAQNGLIPGEPDFRQRFESAPLPSAITAALESAYAPFAQQPVAVRSSATAEDLPDLSFAGQQETFLNVRGADELRLAVRRCWGSLWSDRAVAYRLRAGVAEDVALAVVVQSLVNADVAGVAFSVDPITGAPERVVVNSAWGLGESIVGGLVTPDVFEVDRATTVLVEQRIADKAEMTVQAESGTNQQPVADSLRRAPSLTLTQAQEIAQTALRIEALYGHPVDVEWAMASDRLFVVQARPITTLTRAAPEVVRDPWNDSRLGDYLWTNGNLGEAVPDVMTPVTWSLMQRLSRDAIADIAVPGCPTVGNIGGRCYLNVTLLYTIAASFGASGRFAAANEEVFGRLPEDLVIPRAQVSRWTLLRAIARPVPQLLVRTRRYQSRIPGFVADNPARCEALRAHIAATTDTRALGYLWRSEIEPLYREGCFMLQAAGRQGNSALVMTRARLRTQVGEEDADALFSGLHSENRQLASLGLLEGLQQVAAGEIDAQAFAWRFGHRGPHEFEVARPRPGEDPAWLDQQLAQLRSGELPRLFERRETTRNAAWDRFARQQSASTVKRVRHDVAEWGRIERDREATRSELVRVFWVMRDFLVRAGQLSGTADDLFYLPIDEVVSVLDRARGMPDVSLARAAFASYSALPAYPRLIRGRFDPFTWAADPNRRSDLYVEGSAAPPTSDAVVGFPGAAGVVEATVRVLDTPEQGDLLQPGEVLVTRVTNVGWTPLFPRAAAVVTDVGAPLSHAAIVARELGIPAVVGAGNATMRLRTGMRVRVDGSRGTVEVL